jgi:ParB-like chromosome segregation protein Spo0J
MREGEGQSAAVRASTLTSTSDDVTLADRAPDGRKAAHRALVQPGAEVVPCASLKAADSPRLDGESIDHITVLAQAGVHWPPIVVHRQTMRVIDGMHRLRAAQLRGDQSVEVNFFDGHADDAFIAAVRANITHGLPLTLADRKAAAQRILGCQPHRSDRWIGQATGLAAGTVAAIRRRAGTADVQGPSRLGRDGRVRPLDAADGRLRAQQEISARPDASLREIANAAGISPATAKDVRDRLRRGDDVVPQAEQKDRNGKRATAGRLRTDGRASGNSPGAERSLDWSLQRLMRDPSLRYSEPGRRLLRTLELHARGPTGVEELIDAVPAHCGYLVARLVRQCARQWLELADALERAPRVK